jgi:4-amino-4-deoxy-L-arabinose transferase-like glycosyltransferase
VEIARMDERSTSIWPIVLLAGLLFFLALDSPLLEPQEARYAEIPRQMLHEHSPFVPVLHGQPYLDKPPLLYWLVMLAYSTCGVHGWAARLVPGFCGVLTVLVVLAWGRRLGDAATTSCGALVLLLSARFVYLARMLTFDTLLSLCIVASWATAHVALRGPQLRRSAWIASALAAGLGLLAKGPVALVLVALPLAAWIAVERRAMRPRLRDLLLYVGLALGVATPWFAAMELRQPGFLADFFWRHHVERFAAPFDHEEPFWFFLPGVLLGMLPWTLLLPALLRRVARRDPATRVLWFPLLCCGTTLLFFSLSGCKRAVYILPALPPLALTLGWELRAQLAVSPLRRRLWPAAGVGVALLLLTTVFVGQPWYNARFGLRPLVEAVGQKLASETVVVCYPRLYDSVSFYLRREVRGFQRSQEEALLTELMQHDATFLFVKAGHDLEELRKRLPDGFVFEAEQQHGAVIAGWVRQRVRTAAGTRTRPRFAPITERTPRVRGHHPGL